MDDNKEKLVIQMKFNVYYPAKIIKIIQTGKCTNLNVSQNYKLAFYHFDIFGLYFRDI